MYELKAIIFDVDGTLADTEEIHRQAFNQAFREFKYDCFWSAEEYKQLLQISGGKERIRYYLQENDIESNDPDELWELTGTIHARKSEIYRQMLVTDRIELRPGVMRLIKEARQNDVTMAIVTSSSRKNIETLLLNAIGDEALSWFNPIVTCDIVDELKPSPAAYKYAIAEMDIDPRFCIAIEDTKNGNEAARDAGLKTIITTHLFTIDDDFAGASLVVNQLGEPHNLFTVAAGKEFGTGYVDILLLQRILSPEEDNYTQDEWHGKIVTSID